MKILLIANCVFYGGGTQTYIRQISDDLHKKGHEIFYLSINKKDSIQKDKNHYHLKEFDSPFNRYLSQCFVNPLFIIRSFNVIRKVKPNIIYILNTHHMNSSILLAIWLSRVPAIQKAADYEVLSCPSYISKKHREICEYPSPMHCMFNCVDPLYIPEVFNYRIAKIISNHILKKMIVPTKDLYNWLSKRKVKNLVFIPHFSPIIPRKIKPVSFKNRNKFLYVGRLTIQKGVQCLIEAISIVKKDYPKIHLYICGFGDDELYLKSLATRLHLTNNVKFFGRIVHSRIGKFYNLVNCTITPTINKEGACFVAFESLTFKRPVIATNRGAFPGYVIPGVTGFLSEPGSEIDLANQIKKLLTDWRLAKKMGENGYRLVTTKYTRKKHMEKLHNILNKEKRDY